jgi:hypothetical protein
MEGGGKVKELMDVVVSVVKRRWRIPERRRIKKISVVAARAGPRATMDDR